MGCCIIHKFVQRKHILPQAADHKEGTVIRPRGSGAHHGSRLLHRLIGILAWIAKHEFPRPKQILARLALISILGILTNCQYIVWLIRDTAADPGLRNAIRKTKVLMPPE